jgi:hypothetical protein
MSNYQDKIDNVIKTRDLKNLYYLGFVSTVKEVFLVNFKINTEHIKNVGVKQSTRQGTSIFMKNFIAPELGTVKIYKSKKRIELRLKKSVVENEHAVRIYELAKPISDGSGDVEEDAEEDEEISIDISRLKLS